MVSTMPENANLLIDYGSHTQEFYNITFKETQYGDEYKLTIYSNNKPIREVALTGSWKKEENNNTITFKKVD